MGESKLKRIRAEETLLSSAGVQTPNGKIQVRWESTSAATLMGQLAYFIEFLGLTGLWSRWQETCPLASPEARREAITSRPWLMSSIGRRTEHAGQATITLTGLHAHFDKARRLLMQVSARLQAWANEIAEQLRDGTVWLCVCDHPKQNLAAVGPPGSTRLIGVIDGNCRI